MLKHIVMWKFLPQAEGRTKEENISFVCGEVKKLPAVIPQIRSLSVGADVLGSDMSFDCGLVAEFDSEEDMLVYKKHPAHVAVSQYVKKVRSDRAVVDFYD